MNKGIVENRDFGAKHLGEGCQLHEPNSNEQNGRPPEVKQRDQMKRQPTRSFLDPSPHCVSKRLCTGAKVHVLSSNQTITFSRLKTSPGPNKNSLQRLETSLAQGA